MSTNAKGTFAGGTFRAGTYDGLWLQAMKTEPAAAYYYSDYSASGEVEQQVIFRRHPTNGAATTPGEHPHVAALTQCAYVPGRQPVEGVQRAR
ncbi:hypothetical protein [Fodinicurvata halophila]|uniref:hypothetical protein n=1 Tax=Fodinicurvata halophila TaxID=1419723 RepID=UPI00362AAA80